MKSEMKTKTNSLSYFFSSVFFSGWIEKGGVVPRLRSAALRFFPILTFFIARRFFVTRVFETMTSLLQRSNNLRSHPWSQNFQALLLPPRTQAVKASLLILTFFWTVGEAKTQRERDSLIIATGEHREISLPNLKKFTVTNPSIISYQHNESENILLLKGKSVGHGEIVAWKTDGNKRVYRVHVYSKGDYAGSLNLEHIFQEIGLKATPFGPLILVQGEIKSLSDYRLIHRLEKDHHQALTFSKTSLSPKLTSEIISKVYRRFFDQFKDNIRCWGRKILVSCEYEKSDPPTKKDLKYLKEHLFIHLMAKDEVRLRPQNYHVRLKIIQEEQLDGREISTGLEKIEAQVEEIFESGLQSLIGNNRVVFKDDRIDVSTLASPELFMRPGEPGLISIGSELPYETQGKYGNGQIQWRFAGLKINLVLNPKGERIHLDYEMEFTRPQTNSGQQSISGSREKASLLLSPGKGTKLFQVMFQTQGKAHQKIPLLGHIPLIGKLFQSMNHQQTYKRITGYLVITPKRVMP